MIKQRLTLDEISRLSIVVLHDTVESKKDILVAGWVDEDPHYAEDAAIVLYEPVYFTVTPASDNGSMSAFNYILPTRGLPLCMEFFDYSRVEVHEGSSSMGRAYVQAIGTFREYPVQIKPFLIKPAMTQHQNLIGQPQYR